MSVTAAGSHPLSESDFVNVRGEHHRGATAIARGHQGIFDTIYAGSTVRYRLELARELAGVTWPSRARPSMCRLGR